MAIDLDLNVRSKPALHLMAMYGFECAACMIHACETLGQLFGTSHPVR